MTTATLFPALFLEAKQQFISRGETILDFLYGDEAKTNRTFALCIMAIALSSILNHQSTLHACGI